VTATSKPRPAAPTTYAIVRTGGKQYRVSEGQRLLVERLPVSEGETVSLAPLLLIDDSELTDGDGLSEVTVTARVVAHERGPKLRVVKFKPKRGYKRRTGHRQDLTRIQIESIARGGAALPATRAEGSPAPVRAGAAEGPTGASGAAEAPAGASGAAEAPAGQHEPNQEEGNGA
jgi:large subunit ribosomal protein L21